MRRLRSVALQVLGTLVSLPVLSGGAQTVREHEEAVVGSFSSTVSCRYATVKRYCPSFYVDPGMYGLDIGSVGPTGIGLFAQEGARRRSSCWRPQGL